MDSDGEQEHKAVRGANDEHLVRGGRVLGVGAFSTVQLGTYQEGTSSARIVAIKRLRPDLLLSRDAVEEFFHEARLLRELKHPHIVEFICAQTATGDDGAPCGSVYIVQEFMTEGTLKSMLLRQMERPWKRVYSYTEALTWLAHVAAALTYLHSWKPAIIHRDVKLENVLLTRDADTGQLVAKLADFGVHALMKLPEKEAPKENATVQPPRRYPSQGVIMVSGNRTSLGGVRLAGK